MARAVRIDAATAVFYTHIGMGIAKRAFVPRFALAPDCDICYVQD